MKKYYSGFILMVLVSSLSVLQAQNIVTTVPQYQSAVLEEYTGIYCQYCPDGHLRAKQLKNNYPGRVVLINVHQGGYANPNGSDPDFRTPWGNALAAQTGLTGYPTGTVNRMVFPEFGNAMAINRGEWRPAAEEVMDVPSPVNIGASTSYDDATREITIEVEAYYTADANESTNLLNIALIQDSIPGPQTGAAAWNPDDILSNGKYKHDHMLRDLITGQWGDTISNTTKGSLYTKTYTYTIPNDVNGVNINPDKCHLAIFISENKKDIRQGLTIGIDGDQNDGNNGPYYGLFAGPDNAAVKGDASVPVDFDFGFTPTISGDYRFELIANAPSDWSHSYSIEGTSYTDSQTLSLTEGTPVSIGIEVTAGNTNSLEDYTLIASPVSDSASQIIQKVYVIKGISDLIVNGSGTFGDGEVYNWETIYSNALASTSSSNSFAIAQAETMAIAVNSGAMDDVNNLYLNIGWTFPSFSDDEAMALMDFMDAGGNVFVSGQDIGWDINHSSGYGTVLTRRLYRNYFNAMFNSDDAGENSLSAVRTDIIFGGLPDVSISDKYDGNFYPDLISPRSGAQAIFRYGDSEKTAGIRYENDDFKIVYLGVGLEMIDDESIRNSILELSHNWFNNMISTEEFDSRVRELSLFPNPTHGQLTLEVAGDGLFEISVTNVAGQEIYRTTREVSSHNDDPAEIKLELKDLPQGVYTLKATNDKHSYVNKVILK